MRKFVIFILAFYSGMANAQPLRFAESYDLAFGQARTEGKKVFVYAYSPCRLCDDMRGKVLSIPDIARFLNESFVLVDMDLDEREGVLFKRKYRLQQCPVILLFDCDERLLHKIAGVCPGEELLDKIFRGIEPKRCYAGVMDRYAGGERTVELLSDYLLARNDAGETVDRAAVAQEFFSHFSLEERVSRKAWSIFDACVSDYRDSLFQHFLREKECFVSDLGEETVNTKIRQILMAAFQRSLEDTIGADTVSLCYCIKKAGMPEKAILGKLWELYGKKDYAAIMDVYEKEVFQVEPRFRSQLGDFLFFLMKGADQVQNKRVAAYIIECLVDLRKRRSHKSS